MKTILLIFSVFLVPISVFGQTDASKSESNPLLKSTNAVKLRLASSKDQFLEEVMVQHIITIQMEKT
jgi:hypothetical protein